MATGSLVSGICYETVGLATDVYFSGLSVQSVLSASGVLLITEHVKDVAGNWNLKQVSMDAFGVQSVVYQVVVSPPLFSACDAPSESFAYGVDVGWVICALCLSAFFVRVVMRTMQI